MAVVITVAQQKGGAGKTTLAANLAAALAPRRRVAVLDIDPQRSLARWHALRAARGGAAPVGLSDVSGWRLAAELDRMRRFHDVLIVDSPPQIDTDARLAVRGADLVLVPLQPSPPDLWAAEGTLALAAAERRPARLRVQPCPRHRPLAQRGRGRRSRDAGCRCSRQRSATAPASPPPSRAGLASPKPRQDRWQQPRCWRCWRRSKGSSDDFARRAAGAASAGRHGLGRRHGLRAAGAAPVAGAAGAAAASGAAPRGVRAASSA